MELVGALVTSLRHLHTCLLLFAEAVGIDPSAAAAATPKPTAETIDSNQLGSEEGKNTPDVFVRKETVSRPAAAVAAGGVGVLVSTVITL